MRSADLRRRARRRSRLRLAFAVSLLFHVLIVVLLFVTLKRRGREEMLPPPSPVTMVFETGRRQGPTLPEPSLQATPSVPSPPAEAPVLPEPPAPPPPPPAAPPAPPAPPLAAPPVPKVLPPAAEVPPPLAERPLPLPVPPPKPAPVQPPRPAPAAPRPRPVPQKPSDFPAPMDFSFGKPLAMARPASRAPSVAHRPGTIDMSLGPAQKGTTNLTPRSDDDDESGGPDWRNALSLWVAQHAYYPPQAVKEFEEGDAKVHVVAQHNGRVTSVELIGKSGSMWLDLALQALFRDARIPPLPEEGNDPIEFNFTMHYILRRAP